MRNNIENIKAFLIETLQRKNAINLFANYFSRMEENFAKLGLQNEFENFIHSYLTIYSNGEILHKDTESEKNFQISHFTGVFLQEL